MGLVDLDDLEAYGPLDPGDMYRRVDDLANQIERSWTIAANLQIPDSYRDSTAAVVVGMGGSAIGGSLFGAYAESELPIPFSVWRGYGLPGFVDDRTLVIIASYSGQTEETLSGFEMARERGARIIAITTGGKVGEVASQEGYPAVRFEYAAQPRATLGYLFTPLPAIFAQLGLLPSQEVAIAEAITVAREARERWGATTPHGDNLAKQLAHACLDRTVVVYGAEYLAAVARRWKTQLNENSKQWAFWEEFPELDHNAIVGYERPVQTNGSTQVVVLRGRHLNERIDRRIDVTTELLEQYGVPYEQVVARGEGRIAEMVSLIALGDYVSYYLALLNGVDPTIITPIDRLKAALATSSSGAGETQAAAQ